MSATSFSFFSSSLRNSFAPKRVGWVMVGTLLMLIAACSTTDNKVRVDEDGNYTGILVVYDERESNENSTMFQTEIRILPDRMLITDNRGASSYLLVDREKKTIYNINNDDKTIMEIKQQPIGVTSPLKLDYKLTSQPSAAIPKIASVQATHYSVEVNGEHCYDVVSAGQDFLPDITSALVEFRQILASEHAKSIKSIPKDLLNACDLAINIFNSSDHLVNGFPFREWDNHGYLRFVRFWRMDAKIKPASLELPKDYQVYSIP